MAYKLDPKSPEYQTIMKSDNINLDDGLNIPPQWVRSIKHDNGKPNVNAVLVLACIVKHYTGTTLTVNYSDFVDILGLTRVQVSRACKNLQSMGLICRDFDVTNSNMSVTLNTDRVIELTDNEDFEMYPEGQKVQVPKEGFVYLVYAKGLSHPYKIGSSKDPEKRVKRFFTITMPFDIELVKIIPCDDMMNAETHLHELFSESRGRGEWFDLSPDDVEDIKLIQDYQI